MTRTWILSVGLLAISTSLSAQEIRDRHIGFGTGYAYDALKSERVSNFTQVGATSVWQFLYRINQEKNRHHFQFYYSSSTLHSSSSGLKTDAIRGQEQYAYHRRIGTGNGRISVFGGGVFDGNLNYRQNTTSVNLGTQKDGQLVFSLSPSVLAEMPLGKDMVAIQGWASMIAFARQSGYSLSYPAENNWLTIPTFFKIESRMSYVRYFSERWDGRLDYQFQYYKMQKYETVIGLSHQFVFSLVYKFHKK